MLSMPDWLLGAATPWFVALYEKCAICAWCVIAVPILAFALCIWQFARGHELFKGVPTPAIITGGRAFVGVLWLLALLAYALFSGSPGLAPLLGDTVFVVFGSFYCVERYVWARFPPSVGKLTEIAVLAAYWGIAWLIADKVPVKLSWYMLVITASMSILFLANRVSNDFWRRILLRNVLPPIIVACLLVPPGLAPVVPTTILWVSLGLLLAWLGVMAGALWLKLPDTVANGIAPLWFTLSIVLAAANVPGFVG
jgi:hypothetical protein